MLGGCEILLEERVWKKTIGNGERDSDGTFGSVFVR
jgi:hypothetical protein